MNDEQQFLSEKTQKNIQSNKNNSNAVKETVKVASHSGNPYIAAVGKGVNVADKLSGDKVSEKLGNSITNANRMSGLKSKMLQNTINKTGENGTASRLSNAINSGSRRANGLLGLGAASRFGKDKTSDNVTSSSTEESDESNQDGGTINFKVDFKILRWGLIASAFAFPIIIFMVLFVSASQTYIKVVGLSHADSLSDLSDPNLENKINKKQTDPNSDINEEITDEDIGFEYFIDDDRSISFRESKLKSLNLTQIALFRRRKYTETTLEDLADFYPQVTDLANSYNERLVYDFFFKMYRLNKFYNENYKTVDNTPLIDLPLLMATLMLQSDDIGVVFASNLEAADREDWERDLPIKDYSYDTDWSGYVLSRDSSVHDMEILAQHMVSKNGEYYVHDAAKYREFLKEFIEKKYYLEGQSIDSSNDSDYNSDYNSDYKFDSEFTSSFVSWVVAIANDDSHGYSQSNRANLTDFDCSSLVYFGLLNSGFTTNQLGGTWPFTTATQPGILKSNGFKEISFSSITIDGLKPGDILWRSDHTEVYYGNGKKVGAHMSEDPSNRKQGKVGDQTGSEISINEVGSNWTYVYRYGG